MPDNPTVIPSIASPAGPPSHDDVTLDLTEAAVALSASRGKLDAGVVALVDQNLDDSWRAAVGTEGL